MQRATFLAAVLAVLVSSLTLAADEPAKTEAQKIERLIEHVGKLGKAKFVRNDVEYDAAAAEKFLRAKWKSMGTDIKTAAEFIEKIATKSSTTGKPYLIRFPDGKERNSGEYLAEQLKKEALTPQE